MKSKIAIRVLYFTWVIAAGMLAFAAVEKQSDSFYTLLRWVGCGVFAYSAVTSFQMKRMLWLGIFAVLATVFNPVVVVPLERGTWIVADWLSIGAMAIAALVFWKASNA